jgi:hypothetical protein
MALVDANMVDEDRFFAQLATGLGMPFAENGIADAAEGLHSRFRPNWRCGTASVRPRWRMAR